MAQAFMFVAFFFFNLTLKTKLQCRLRSSDSPKRCILPKSVLQCFLEMTLPDLKPTPPPQISVYSIYLLHTADMKAIVTDVSL